MKTDRPKELRQLTIDELNQKLRSSREELFKLRYDAKSGRIEKPDRIKAIKRNIARILTILKEKEDVKKKQQ